MLVFYALLFCARLSRRKLIQLFMRQQVRIGTSGWHYKHWRGNFYPAKIKVDEMLSYYTQHLDSVEINNSFYRLPTADAVRNWVRHTPDEFLFSVKGSRYITHNRKLNDPKRSIAKFMKMVEGFGEKLGPILFQLPPKWNVNADRVREFLKALPRGNRYAFEFRHPSWFTDEIYGILRHFNAALCIYEIAGFQSPVMLTADFTYIRLHGPAEKAYQGKYSAKTLRKWADEIETWRSHGCQVYFYFDNDQAGCAVRNAIELLALTSNDRDLKPSAPRAAS